MPYIFNVLTDKPNDPFYKTIDAVTHHVPDWPEANGERKYWWYKMQMFNRAWGFTDTILYLDLDVIIINSIDKFVDYTENFAVCQDFNRRWIRDYVVSNTSVMCFHAPNYYKIFKSFNKNVSGNISKFRGDQDYITHYFKERNDLKWWPNTWCQSFKWDCYRGGLIESGTGLDEHGKWPADPSKYMYPEQPWIMDAQCSIVVFHGDPDPWITEFGKQNLLPDV